MDRAAEIAKYEACYQHDDYRMGRNRKRHITTELSKLPRGSLLDVGTGRGETLDLAEELGFGPVAGTEAVHYLCDDKRVVYAMAHALPFQAGAFDYVTMFDVLEHLIPEDTAPVVNELCRVARKAVVLTVCNKPSTWQHGSTKMDLHINRRDSYQTWHDELKQITGREVQWVSGSDVSEMFLIPVA